jgi:tRNA threonylcarbamoyladenosine biosynthesis protein TsaB
MAIILNIDTAQETAMISISRDGQVMEFLENVNQRDHAAFLQPAVKKLLQKVGLNLTDLNAVAVSGGPGSYTGLRVGLASAKGFCYTLSIPLIIINSLEVLALSAIMQTSETVKTLYCPMIDARRMEVFTAVYDTHLNQILSPLALILQNNSLDKILEEDQVIFIGSGSDKFRSLTQSPHAIFSSKGIIPNAIGSLAEKKYQRSAFSDLYLSEPLYIKDFHTI